MRTAVVGLKPDLDPSRLLDLTLSVIESRGHVCLVSFVSIGNEGDELQRMEKVKARVRATAAELEEQGYETTTEVQLGSTGLGTELAGIAERIDADLIVIGLIKRSRVGKALLGSDAQSVLMNAHCPVLASRLE